MEAVRELTGFQDAIVNDYLEKGGRGRIDQIGRGTGYSTAVMYLAIQQLLSTNRSVLFLTDTPNYHALVQLCDIAVEFFGARPSRSNGPAGVLINGKFLRVLNPRHQEMRGIRVDDIYGDVSSDTIRRREDAFYELSYRYGLSREDGTGFYYLVVR